MNDGGWQRNQAAHAVSKWQESLDRVTRTAWQEAIERQGRKAVAAPAPARPSPTATAHRWTAWLQVCGIRLELGVSWVKP